MLTCVRKKEVAHIWCILSSLLLTGNVLWLDDLGIQSFYTQQQHLKRGTLGVAEHRITAKNSTNTAILQQQQNRKIPQFYSKPV